MAMNVHFFSTKSYDRIAFTAANVTSQFQFTFHEAPLQATTAVLAAGAEAVCAFVNDTIDAACILALKQAGVRIIALRCAGFNNVDLPAAQNAGLTVVRVPAYSPYAVAEHTLGLILCLNRSIHRAFNRVREGNFSLAGFTGFDLHGKTVGLVGTGRIGAVMADICLGLGCRVLANDPIPNAELQRKGVVYDTVGAVIAGAHILSLHCPLGPESRHMINSATLATMRPGAMLVNTSRGGLVDTKAVIEALKSDHLGGFAIDVYEEEAALFFEDHSQDIIADDIFMRLTTFPNVLITGHQAFLTHEALAAIATTTLANIASVVNGQPCANTVGLG